MSERLKKEEEEERRREEGWLIRGIYSVGSQ